MKKIETVSQYIEAKKELARLIDRVSYDSMLIGYRLSDPRVQVLSNAISEYEAKSLKQVDKEKKDEEDEYNYDLSSYVMNGFTDWG